MISAPAQAMTSTTPMTVHVSSDEKERLDRLARLQKRPSATLARDAIRAYVEQQEWQLAEIRAGLREADAGEFATAAEIRAVFERWIDEDPLDPAGTEDPRRDR